MTEKSVKTFQLSNNLIPDGIIGTKSREILNQEKISTTIYQQTQPIAKTYTLTKKLSFRSPLNDPEEVKLLQQILITKGYLLDTNIDGLFGSKVLQSVISFQRANNLSPDGVVGIQTREYLNK